MEYRVETLAQAAGVRVDTVRFYQSRGLLLPPRRVGRTAIYDEHHLGRLRRIRELQGEGFTLEQIQRVLEQPDEAPQDNLLAALVKQSVGERSFSGSELAAETGLPEVMVEAAKSTGLLQPLRVDGQERFSEADAEIARIGLALIESGFPLHLLLEQAVSHADHIKALCDHAIDLFDDHVRKAGPTAGDDAEITDAFQRLLPLVTRVIAVHFQRTLVTRALERLEGKEEMGALEAALRATESAHLEVDVSWR
jgi:DNA-binding transcriptional MerR regulator